MTLNDIFLIIGNLGFPIVISIYLINYFGKKIDKLNEVIQSLILEVKNENHKIE